jgi:hypothetical protein
MIARCNSVARRRRGGKVLDWGGVVLGSGELMVATFNQLLGIVIEKVKVRMERDKVTAKYPVEMLDPDDCSLLGCAQPSRQVRQKRRSAEVVRVKASAERHVSEGANAYRDRHEFLPCKESPYIRSRGDNRARCVLAGRRPPRYPIVETRIEAVYINGIGWKGERLMVVGNPRKGR